MERAEVTDLYEAAYLVVRGGRIEGVSCVSLSSGLGCIFSISGEGLAVEQEEFHGRMARVNLYAFRTAYSQVDALMRMAKKGYGRDRRRQRREGK